MPKARIRKSLKIRFYRRCKQVPGKCWEWTGNFGKDGYGSIADDNYRRMGAHRASWEIHRSLIPPGLQVLHHCDNPPCTNPDHLFLGTSADNTADKMTKGRHRCPRGSRHPAAKITESDVVKIRRQFADGTFQKTLSVKFGIDQAQISRICSRSTWRHVE